VPDDEEKEEWDDVKEEWDDEEKEEWDDRWRSGDRDGESGTEGDSEQDIWDSRRWRASCWEWRRRYFCRANARSGSFRRGEEDADMVPVDVEEEGSKMSSKRDRR